MKVIAYCDASLDQKTGAVGLGSMFSVNSKQENRMCGDLQPGADNNTAELYAIVHCLRHVKSVVEDTTQLDLKIVTDSDDALRQLQVDESNMVPFALEVYKLNESFKSVEFIPIKGHCENKSPHHMGNCHVDKMAKLAMREVREKVYREGKKNAK